ncbi:Proteophosphoglycan 5 [Microbacterium esteraromaticum]|uniref:Proteophosphoglycan 5 n=1 Tax=Microbacterium esteraromaticum TaxID=57043 RepID=A0A1R4KFH4_9MICO|nr:hypothetical protein [Microbacterium esteraromaticum]SJN43080.1 Proteophosphoglycan 5 [Microbacterium esteraromaticum]
MSTSDQNGQERLTRKQLREIRLTGSTPVITESESAAAAEQPVAEQAAPEQAPAEQTPAEQAPTTVDAMPTDAPDDAAASDAPLTRREMRAQELARTGSVPVPAADEAEEADALVEDPQDDAPEKSLSRPDADAVAGLFADASAGVTAEAAGAGDDTPLEEDTPELVSAVPVFSSAPAAATMQPATPEEAPAAEEAPAVDDAPEDETQERPMVGEAFGIGVKAEEKPHRLPALFDDLIDGSSGSQHTASHALIFTPSPGVGSLSGPVAATGEMLITGTYALPDGMGSQGHALGLADGREADAVLLDGELAPSSSPTPVAASSAISTSKPAGEVIRPPVPDTGNKLMLTLAIVAGGLALALAAALIIAFTTRVFG